jgi:uncharacterized membrane protein
MDEEKLRNLMLLGGSTALGAVGQLLFKYAFVSSSLIEWLFFGIAVYGAATLVYFYVLSRAHLSWTYGIGGLSYIFATFLAYFVLAENVPPLRWLGVVVITIGVVLIGTS